jgi:hypothetical protein
VTGGNSQIDFAQEVVDTSGVLDCAKKLHLRIVLRGRSNANASDIPLKRRLRSLGVRQQVLEKVDDGDVGDHPPL